MRLQEFSDAHAFLEAVGTFFHAAEAENNLMRGIAQAVAQHDGPYRTTPFLGLVRDADAVVLAALRTPPRDLIVTNGPVEAVTLLAKTLSERHELLPGVLGPVTPATEFARQWSARTGQAPRRMFDQHLYRLDRVEHAGGVPGRLRPVHPGEIELAHAWHREFNIEALQGEYAPESRETISRAVAEGRVLFWDDGRPVCLVATNRRTTSCAGIAPVFTPPALRNRGYGQAAVAALADRLLAAGARHVVLYADAANLASNRVYRNVGFTRVMDTVVYKFENPSDG